MEHEAPIAVVRRDPGSPGLEISVNFGVFAGRNATPAELEQLGRALQPEVGEVAVVAEQRRELTGSTEIALHQVKIQVPDERLPQGEFALGELAGRLATIAESWARACFAERRIEIEL